MKRCRKLKKNIFILIFFRKFVIIKYMNLVKNFYYRSKNYFVLISLLFIAFLFPKKILAYDNSKICNSQILKPMKLHLLLL